MARVASVRPTNFTLEWIRELTLRYTTPDIRCRHRRHECDRGIMSFKYHHNIHVPTVLHRLKNAANKTCRLTYGFFSLFNALCLRPISLTVKHYARPVAKLWSINQHLTSWYLESNSHSIMHLHAFHAAEAITFNFSRHRKNAYYSSSSSNRPTNCQNQR